MYVKKILAVLIMVFCPVAMMWAGDTAVFADLGFSPDGKIYMFAQYGVQSDTLRQWAELYIVDVANNSFVSDGRLSYVHPQPVKSGQDGSGALYHLLTKNVRLADQYKVDFLSQGRPLYISIDEPAAPPSVNIEFRDFDAGAAYKASIISSVEGSSALLRSSFYINLERTARNGTVKTYRVGTPQVKRPGIASYRIQKAVIAPQEGSMILVIEMKKHSGSTYDIRYMIEALKL